MTARRQALGAFFPTKVFVTIIISSLLPYIVFAQSDQGPPALLPHAESH